MFKPVKLQDIHELIINSWDVKKTRIGMQKTHGCQPWIEDQLNCHQFSVKLDAANSQSILIIIELDLIW